MSYLHQYQNVRNMPPGEIPGGVRYYTGEEVSAYRTVSGNGIGTPRQWELYRQIVDEIAGTPGPGVNPPAAAARGRGDVFISVDFGGVFTGAALTLFAGGAIALAYCYLNWLFDLLWANVVLSVVAIVGGVLLALFLFNLGSDPIEPENDDWL